MIFATTGVGYALKKVFFTGPSGEEHAKLVMVSAKMPLALPLGLRGMDAAELDEIKTRARRLGIDTEKYNIAVCGLVKSGKSTFLNAILKRNDLVVRVSLRHATP